MRITISCYNYTEELAELFVFLDYAAFMFRRLPYTVAVSNPVMPMMKLYNTQTQIFQGISAISISGVVLAQSA